MSRLSSGQRESLGRAARLYNESLDDAALTYLEGRGLADEEIVATYLLGVVREPIPGHEDYLGRLSIPYATPSGVVALRFRCIEDHEHGKPNCAAKYLDLPGQEAHLYNVDVLRTAGDTLYVTEGELDAISATVVGYPAVGVSGATKWKDHWSYNLEDFEEVVVLADGDDAGRSFAEKVRSKVERARAVFMPIRHDVNSVLVGQGLDAFEDLVGPAPA